MDDEQARRLYRSLDPQLPSRDGRAWSDRLLRFRDNRPVCRCCLLRVIEELAAVGDRWDRSTFPFRRGRSFQASPSAIHGHSSSHSLARKATLECFQDFRPAYVLFRSIGRLETRSVDCSVLPGLSQIAGGPKIAPAKLFAAKKPISKRGDVMTSKMPTASSHHFEMCLLLIFIVVKARFSGCAGRRGRRGLCGGSGRVW